MTFKPSTDGDAEVDPIVIKVSSLSDLPSPVGDVITVVNGKVYDWKGIVDISPNRLLFPTGSTITFRGSSSLQDTVVSNVSGDFITGQDVFITMDQLSFETPNADFFDITQTSLTNIIMTFVDILDYNTLGSITDTDYVLMDNMFIDGRNSVGGLSFFGTCGILLLTNTQLPGFRGTLVNLGTAIFTDIFLRNDIITIDRTDPLQIIMLGTSDNGNIDIPLSGFGRVDNVHIRQTNVNDPVVTSAIQNVEIGDKYWWFSGNPTAPDSRHFAQIDSEANTNTTVLSLPDTFVQVTTDNAMLVEAQRFKLNVSNELEFDAIQSVIVTFIVNIAAEKASGGSAVYKFTVFKNGLAGDKVALSFPLEVKTTVGTISFTGQTTLIDGDVLDVFVQGVGHSDNINIITLSFQING